MVFTYFGIAHFFMKANARVRHESIVFPVGRGYAGIYGKNVLLKQPLLQLLI